MASPAATSPHDVFKSLEWIEDVVWDLTGLPDVFVTLLSHCSSIYYDRDQSQMHEQAALKTVELANSANSLFDAEGPGELGAAVKKAATDLEFASTLASLCETYYFLRSLNVFYLSNSEFDGLVELLKAGDQVDAGLYTHADAVGSLNVYLDKLEANHPGIKHYANCAMLEANIVQEFDTTYELLHGLRDQLPSDGDLYMATLRSIVNSAHDNATMAQVIENAHALYVADLAQYWTTAANTIWEVLAGTDADADADYELLDGSITEYTGPQGRELGMAH
ncbi:hypothetical protein H4R24_001224 [Coemansia sp. RSA 988]|nr:hypothetical protein H4R24_001224 [Coemansia sp. RSA 988]